MRFLSKPASIIHEQKRRGIRRVQQQQGGEEEGEEMPLLRQINFAEGLLFRVAVQRENDLQGKPAILTELSSNATTALTTIPAPISSGPMKNPTSSPSHRTTPGLVTLHKNQ